MQWLTDFHFIRPLWLLTLLPMLFIWWQLRSRSAGAGDWQQVIDPELLPHLLDSEQLSNSRPNPLWRLLMLSAAVVAALALAGPTWKKLPQPVSRNQDALIIMLDMSASMAAQDVKPSRYVRATQKITDIIRARRDGQTALLVYAGDAHTVTPLTDDTATIENLLPSLSPFIMPAPGSRPDKAIELAQQLAADAGVNNASLLLITDGLQAKDVDRIRKVLNSGRSRLSVIAVGTSEGAPVPIPGSGFLRDNDGTIVLPKLDLGPFRSLSSELGVPWQTMSINDSDWQSLLSSTPEGNMDSTSANTNTFDLWADQGYWLVLLLIPVTLLLFRRGVLLSLLLIPFLWPHNSYALEWKDLWQTDDQQAQALFDANPKAAASTFKDPAWAGSAAYRAGDYDAAAQSFSQLPEDAHNLYNLGNALAQGGKLQEAEAAYEKALDKQPDFPEASENLEKVKDALKKQQQQNQSQNGDSKQNDQQQKNGQQDQQQGQQQNQQGQQQNGQQNGQQNQQQQGQQQSSQQQNGQQDGQQGQQQNNPSAAGQKQQDQQQNDPSSATQNAQDKEQQAQDKDQQASAAEQKEDGKQDDDKRSALSEQKDKDGQPADKQQPAASAGNSDLSREEQEAMQQWLKRVPDQPGNLLQRKFLYQYRQKNDQPSEDVQW